MQEVLQFDIIGDIFIETDLGIINMKTESMQYSKGSTLSRRKKKIDFYQKVNGNQYLDFDKIRKMGYPINVIMSGRYYQGKSYNATEHIRKNWTEKGEKSIWLFNTRDALDKASLKISVENRRLEPDKWEGFTTDSEGIRDDKKILWCEFGIISQSAKFKTGRDYSFTTLVYDEFNENVSHLGNRQGSHFIKIVNSLVKLDDPEPNFAIFLLSNIETLANVILSQLQINSLENELTLRSGISGEPLLLVYLPKNHLKLMKQRGTNWTADLAKLVNLYDRDFLAKSQVDNMTNIITNTREQDKYIYQQHSVIVVDNQYLQVWEDEQQQHLFIEKTKPFAAKEQPVHCLRGKDLNSGFIYDIDYKNLILGMYEEARIYFDSFHTKNLINTGFSIG